MNNINRYTQLPRGDRDTGSSSDEPHWICNPKEEFYAALLSKSVIRGGKQCKKYSRRRDNASTKVR